MRKILLLCLALPLAGCADKGAYEAYRASFNDSALLYYEAASTPLLSVELPSPNPGQPYKIVVARDVEPMRPEQIKNSEWAPVASAAIGAVATVGGIYVAGQAITNLAGEVGDAAGVHMSGQNQSMTAVGNKSFSGDHGMSSAGSRESIDVEGEGNTGSMDRPASSDDDTSTTITDESGNTSTDY